MNAITLKEAKVRLEQVVSDAEPTIVITESCGPPSKNQDLLDWLLSCPEKGFFVPIESESTDTR